MKKVLIAIALAATVALTVATAANANIVVSWGELKGMDWEGGSKGGG